MNLLTEAMVELGGVLLPVAAGLLLEELTCGGLVRLLIAPWPGSGRRVVYGDVIGSPRSARPESNRKRNRKRNKEQGDIQ